MVPRNEGVVKALKGCMLTNLYNYRPQWLVDAHAVLDSAVATAYEWEAEVKQEETLGKLLARNHVRKI